MAYLLLTILILCVPSNISFTEDEKNEENNTLFEMENHCIPAFKNTKTWSRTFGKFLLPDIGHTVRQLPRGDYIVGGMTITFPSFEQHGWMIKLNDKGRREWKKIFSTLEDLIEIEVVDDGFLIGGNGKSGDVEIIKMDLEGNVVWEKTFGGNYLDILKKDDCIAKSRDGGFVILATSWSFSNNKGADMWLIKLDENGNKEWERVYGEKEDADIGYGVMEVDDGYIIVGQSYSFNSTDFGWLIKLDENGNKEWEIRKGYSLMSIAVSEDGKYFVTGSIWNERENNFDLLLMKVGKEGSIEYLKTFGNLYNEGGYSIAATQDNGFIICGNREYRGNGDIWLIKVDADGNEIWNKTYGKRGWDKGECVRQTDDGGYIIVGETTQFPWLFFPYRLNIWLIKTDENGDIK